MAYVLKQNLFGHERCGGPGRHCWPLYASLFSLNMALAVTTISLGGYNLNSGQSHVVCVVPGLVMRIWFRVSSFRRRFPDSLKLETRNQTKQTRHTR